MFLNDEDENNASLALRFPYLCDWNRLCSAQEAGVVTGPIRHK